MEVGQVRAVQLITAKKLLVSLLVIGAATVIAAAGTNSSFTAQTTNPSNTLSTSTLVLSDTKSGGTTCYSTGGGSTDTNVYSACQTLTSLSAQKPGDSGTANLTLKNEGSLAASVFKVFASSCTASDASGVSYHGTGNPCT